MFLKTSVFGIKIVFRRGIVDCDYNEDNIVVSNQKIYDFFWEHLKKEKSIL